MTGWAGGQRRKVVAGLVVLISLAYLGVLAWQLRTPYYLTVREVFRQPTQWAGQRLRVRGRVDLQSVAETPAGWRFDLTENALRLPVVYRGKPPANWRKGWPVVVEGRWQGQVGGEGWLAADRLLVQCPSRYTPEGGS
ncbi:MAG: cytochrome c maturation protein CcmE [Limnochordaceae bacterium]|nr:cytochrome c maturation protein CcmE [Limnochordaceae bacterium]